MAYKAISPKWRYQHCREIGVAADYCILQFRYAETGWRTVATCHPAAIEHMKRDGVQAHIELIKLASYAA
jgi:hypothetical protein